MPPHLRSGQVDLVGLLRGEELVYRGLVGEVKGLAVAGNKGDWVVGVLIGVC